MNEPDLFDLAKAERLRDRGIAQASSSRTDLLAEAKHIAVALSWSRNEITSDDVAREMARRGLNYSALGPAAGAIFRRGWEWTGRIVNSHRVANHAAALKVWRRKETP